jgi:hypothetical protein
VTTTTTLSPPVRIFAVLGICAAVGFAAFTFLAGGEDVSTTPAPSAPVVPTSKPSTPAETPRAPAVTRRPSTPSAATRSGFPPAVDRALRHRRLVVVAVYLPRAGVDLVVRGEAQAAAARAGAAFVAVRATNERVMRPLVAKAGLVSDPAVLVVRRPGDVVARLGVSDRDTIAQAVAQARR